jgi:hypothetical protein
LLKNGEVDCANQSTLCIVTNTRSGRQTTTIKRQGSNSNYQKTTIKKTTIKQQSNNNQTTTMINAIASIQLAPAKITLPPTFDYALNKNMLIRSATQNPIDS